MLCDAARDLLIDRIFAGVFLAEVLYRRWCCRGWVHFFCEHRDSGWHIFDVLVVAFAIVSAYVVPFLEGTYGLDAVSGRFTAVRIIRVMRLARLIRLFKVFRQLTVLRRA